MTVASRRLFDDRASLLEEVRRVAVCAGDAIVALAAGDRCAVWNKADASPVTQADLAANAIIVESLSALDARTPIVTEEAPREPGALPARFWLVDPLDGTREFVAGSNEYTVNVALIEDGLPVLGVVCAPALGVTYLAARGSGAYRRDAAGTRPIHARVDGPLVVVASRSHAGSSLAAFVAALPPHTLVELGSSLKLCLVADGTAQLYPRLGATCWWDTAAAHAVVLEAGAQVTALDGTPLRYDGDGMLNPPFVCSSLPLATWSAAARAAG
jgi:3'(2'), 5'-bisphosphate nucleotidase